MISDLSGLRLSLFLLFSQNPWPTFFDPDIRIKVLLFEYHELIFYDLFFVNTFICVSTDGTNIWKYKEKSDFTMKTVIFIKRILATKSKDRRENRQIVLLLLTVRPNGLQMLDHVITIH